MTPQFDYSPGFWPSPLTAEAMAQQSGKVSELQILGNSTYWIESRPTEGGRNALMCKRGDKILEVSPNTVSVRTRIQEYGGAPYLATALGVFYVDDKDQRIYFLSREEQQPPIALTAEGSYRYADFYWDSRRQLLWAVREDGTQSTHNPTSQIISLCLETGAIEVKISGDDFYSNPQVSPNGEELVYLSWNHPDMPWQASACYLANLDAKGNILSKKHIAGGRHDGENSRPVSVFAPKFSPKGDLFLVDDRSNWWNIYRYNGRDLECVLSMAAEFATPQWVFGMSTYDFISTKEIAATYTQNGQWHLGIIDIKSGELYPINTSFTDIQQVRAHQGTLAFIAGSPTRPAAVYEWRSGKLEALTDTKAPIPLADISRPSPIKFPTRDGEWAHGFVYPPANAKFALNGKLPPLLVMAHGGPTGATETTFSPKVQFWTTRGFAVLDVNYRGSTGFGRRYRDRLLNQWGVLDVIDVCSGAEFLAKQGLVDANKMVIRGSSAGGFTVLASLTFDKVFKAGASLYGIGDLAALAKDTHKFEAHYLNGLVAPYPEGEEVYRARSPIHHIDKLACPVIFLQGLEDKIVPPSQAEAMVDALKAKGIRTEYVTFADEAHGFRRANNIASAFAAELAFYQQEFLQQQA